MYTNEWSLILFTLLIQAAVGAFIFNLIVGLLLKDKIEQNKLYKILTPTQYAVGFFIIVGSLASVFHLGTPTNAANVFSNIGSSWLSREILFVGGFSLLWLVTFLMGRGKQEINQGLAIVTSVVGLIAVYSMAQIYTSTIIPAWQHFNTFVVFYGTTFLLGTLVSMSTINYAIKKEAQSMEGSLSENIVTSFAYIVIVTVAVQVLVAPIYILSLSNGNTAAVLSAELLYNEYVFLLGLRWLLMLFGGVLLTFLIWKQFYASKQLTITSSQGSIYLAFIVILVGEIIGRYLFYASGVPLMIG